MKYLILASILLAPLAQASDLVCSNPEIQDAHLSAQVLGMEGKMPKIIVSLPTGESSVRQIEGKCSQVIAADEFALTCDVPFDNEGGGWWIVVGSMGTPEISASFSVYKNGSVLENIPWTVPCR